MLALSVHGDVAIRQAVRGDFFRAGTREGPLSNGTGNNKVRQSAVAISVAVLPEV